MEANPSRLREKRSLCVVEVMSEGWRRTVQFRPKLPENILRIVIYAFFHPTMYKNNQVRVHSRKVSYGFELEAYFQISFSQFFSGTQGFTDSFSNFVSVISVHFFSNLLIQVSKLISYM